MYVECGNYDIWKAVEMSIKSGLKEQYYIKQRYYQDGSWLFVHAVKQPHLRMAVFIVYNVITAYECSLCCIIFLSYMISSFDVV